MNKLVYVALCLPLSLLACAAETTTPEEGEGVVAPPVNEATTVKPEASRGTFCLPGEKVVCTLGPPPVCHCEATTPPVIKL
jgi:hypothetical protein